jgi:aspartate kinase
LALIVQKFGGSSVRDNDRIRHVAQLVVAEKQRGNDVIVAVSAMGKTTNNLVAMAREFSAEPPAREMDMLLASGEQISIAMLAIALHSMGHKAISFTGPQVGIKTDSLHGRARIVGINDAKLRDAIGDGKIVIVAGFQGVTGDLEITTLGRGGSDTTGVALAAALQADRCDIYTDVDGVYTADPRAVPSAQRLNFITYDEMLELASVGAKVLHSRAVELAKIYNVPLRVLSSFEPGPGTMIVQEYKDMEKFVVSGVAIDESESQISILGVPDRPGVAASIFKQIAEAGISVDMIIQDVGTDDLNDISFTVDNEDFKAAKELAEQLKEQLGAGGVVTEEGVAKISVVGVGMKSHSGVAAKLFGALASADIGIKSITTSEICVSCLIDIDSAKKAANAIHEAFGLGNPPQISAKT